jgi:hypothetical protein
MGTAILRKRPSWLRSKPSRHQRAEGGEIRRRADLAWRQRAFDRFSAAVELPTLILTVVMIPVLIMPYAVHHLDQGTQSLLDAIDYFIWADFLFRVPN